MIRWTLISYTLTLSILAIVFITSGPLVIVVTLAGLVVVAGLLIGLLIALTELSGGGGGDEQ